MLSEFSPPNWQPVSSTAPEVMANALRIIRLPPPREAAPLAQERSDQQARPPGPRRGTSLPPQAAPACLAARAAPACLAAQAEPSARSGRHPAVPAAASPLARSATAD